MLHLLTLLSTFTPSAHAACTVGSLTPATGTTLTDKTSFGFVMSADCVTSSFEVLVSAWTKTPQVTRIIGGRRVMVVLPTPAEWAEWTAAARPTIAWRITATDTTGATTSRSAVAQLDLDGDGVTRSDEDCDDTDADVTSTKCDNNEDFDDTAVGDWPDGWDIVWDDAGQTIDAGIASDSTGNYLYVRNPDSPYETFAAKKEDVEAEDLEVLFLTSSAYFNFAIRAQGDSATGHNAYLYQSWYGYHMLVQVTGSFDSYGGWTSLTSLTSCSTCSYVDSWVRLRVEGSTLSVRRWLDGDSEPTLWDLEVTDSGISGPGWFGPATYTNYPAKVRRVAWAIDGDTAGF